MDVEQEWTKYFNRIAWSSFASSLNRSWKARDKFKAIFIILYTLFEGIRLSYVWQIQDLETSLLYLAAYHPMGLSGRMFSLTGAILQFESVVLQLIVFFDPRSLLDFNSCMTNEKEASFKRESKLIFVTSYWLLKCCAVIIQSMIIGCGFYYIYHFSFSFTSICLSLIATVMQVVNIEFYRDIYTFYMLWFVSTRKLKYCVQSLFSQVDSPIKYELNRFAQVWHHSQQLNQLSSKISTTCFIFGCTVNAGFFLMVHSLSHSVDKFPLTLLILEMLPPTFVFLQRLTYFVGAATPLQQTISKQMRIYRILFHNKNLSWKNKMQLLNILKGQGCHKTKIALTTIDGRLLETKFLGHHLSYSARIIVMFLKVIRYDY